MLNLISVCLGYCKSLGSITGSWRIIWWLLSLLGNVYGISGKRYWGLYEAASIILWWCWNETNLWACVAIWAHGICVITGCHRLLWSSVIDTAILLNAISGHDRLDATSSKNVRIHSIHYTRDLKSHYQSVLANGFQGQYWQYWPI